MTIGREQETSPDNSDDVVISGISGRFPASDSMDELAYNLYNGIDMACENQHWDPDLFEGTPRKVGGVKSFDKFDFDFFGMDQKRGEILEPVQRKRLEVVYEAMVDAGINPEDLRGTNTGLFMGDCFSSPDSEAVNLDIDHERPEYSFIGNKESWFFDLRGPTFHTDTACASSCCALHEARLSIKKGICDAAIVVSGNCVFDPYISHQMTYLGFMSPTGSCKTLDSKADGYLRAEAVVAIMVQRRKDSKRIYATVVNSCSNTDGYKEEGITFPSGKAQVRLMEGAYHNTPVKPHEIKFIEGHSTGTVAGDPVETDAIHQVFCGKERKDPLLIGCVKSNLGHAEGAAGLISVAKTLLCLQNKMIPPNIHFREPNPKLTAIINGQIVPVIKPTPFDGDYIALNSFGFGGSNAHLLMKSEKSRESNKELEVIHRSIPRLVLSQGRTPESVDYALDYVKHNQKTQTTDFLYLMDAYSVARGKFPYRGYSIMTPFDGVKNKFTEFHQQLVNPKTTVLYFPGVASCDTRNFPVELIFIKLYRNSLKRSKEILQKMKIKWSSLSPIFVAAVNQIAWADCLKELQFSPDHIAGSDLGEYICGYFREELTATDVLTAVQMNHGLIKKLDGKLSDTKWLLPRENLTNLCDTKGWKCITSDEMVRTENGSGPKLLIEVLPTGLRSNISRSYMKYDFLTTLTTLGDIYMNGGNIQISHLYGKPPLPLPSTTPSLSPLIKWDHSAKISLEKKLQKEGRTTYVTKYKTIFYPFDPQKPEDSFILHHKIDSRVLFPATGYLAIAISALTRLRRCSPKDCSIEFKDVQFMRATIVDPVKELVLKCRMDEETGRFEIHEKDTLAVTGYIRMTQDFDGSLPDFIPEESKCNYIMSSGDVYKELRVRGYDYDPFFRGVEEISGDGLNGKIIWRDTMTKSDKENFSRIKIETDIEMDFLRRWICFVDSMMQSLLMTRFETIGRGLFVPTKLKALKFNGREFLKNIQAAPADLDSLTHADKSILDVHSVSFDHAVFTKGLHLIGLKTSLIKRKNDPVTVGKIIMTPMDEEIIMKTASDDLNIDSSDMYPEQMFQPLIQTTVMNLVTKRTTLNVTELCKSESKSPLKPMIDVYEKHSVYSDLVSLKYSMVSELMDENNNNQKSKNLSNIIIDRSFTEMTQEKMNTIASQLDLNGFAWIFVGQASSADMIKMTETANLVYIMEKRITCNKLSSYSVHVMRKVNVDLSTSWLGGKKKIIEIKCNNTSYSWIEEIQQALIYTHETPDARIWLIHDDNGSDDDVSGLIGMTKSMGFEMGGEKIRCLIDPRIKDGKVNFSDPEYQGILKRDLVINMYDGQKYKTWIHQVTYLSPQLLRSDEPFVPKTKVYLKPMTPGDLSSLAWVQSEIPYKSIPDQKSLVDVYYAPLNFKDVMYATGNLPIDLLYGLTVVEARDSLLGLEFSGIQRSTNRRVFGSLLYKGLATTVDATGLEDFLFEVPENWSLEEASTIPAVYLTVLYALLMRGNLARGESILIHAGAGGVGIAALNVCFHHKCEIFVTVGSQEKKDFLMEQFPELKPQNILNSRNLKFEEQILQATNGKGVDVILNSLAGDFQKASLRCLAKNGRFLEIGKTDLVKDHPLNTPDYDGNKSFISVCLDLIYKVKNLHGHDYPSCDKDRNMLRKLLINGIKDGYVKPIKTNVFQMNQAEEAFRFMASGRHIGKIVFKIRDETTQMIHSATDFRIIKQSFFYPHKSYIIIGGLGGLGLEVAQWMTERGAKRIVLASRRGVKDSYQKNSIQTMESKGAKIVVAAEDATTEDGCIKILEAAYKMGAVGGIMNSAVVLDDMMFDVMTPASFEKVAASKAMSTIFMDRLSREYCPELDYFICFSSISNNRGNAGQTNYNYGNSVLDAMCQKRRNDGLHGLSIQWGVLGDVGLVMDKGGYNGKVLLSTMTQRIDSCLATLEKLMQSNEAVVISFVKSRESNESEDDGDLVKIFNRIMGFKDMGSVDRSATLGSLGIDSLMAVELQQMIEKIKGVSINIKDLRGMTINDFLNLAAAEKK